MTPEQIQTAASRLPDALARYGSRVESDLSVIGSGPYKPFYRACALLVAPDQTQEELGMDNGVYPTLEEAMEICRAAHPWFVDALKRDPQRFEDTYGFIRGAWDDNWEDT